MLLDNNQRQGGDGNSASTWVASHHPAVDYCPTEESYPLLNIGKVAILFPFQHPA